MIEGREGQIIMSDLRRIDLAGVEEWREYDFHGRVYRITAPKSVEFRDGGATHRVTGADGIVHCVPAPGTGDCVLRWKGPVIA
jgi:hypothetical protein